MNDCVCETSLVFIEWEIKSIFFVCNGILEFDDDEIVVDVNCKMNKI